MWISKIFYFYNILMLKVFFFLLAGVGTSCPPFTFIILPNTLLLKLLLLDFVQKISLTKHKGIQRMASEYPNSKCSNGKCTRGKISKWQCPNSKCPNGKQPICPNGDSIIDTLPSPQEGSLALKRPRDHPLRSKTYSMVILGVVAGQFIYKNCHFWTEEVLFKNIFPIFPDFRTNRLRKTGCFYLGRILGPRGAQRHLKRGDWSSPFLNSTLTLLLFILTL